MGRTACTEPQCLYKGELYLTVPIYIPDQLSYSVFKVFHFYAYSSTKPVKAFGNERKALNFSLFHPQPLNFLCHL